VAIRSILKLLTRAGPLGTPILNASLAIHEYLLATIGGEVYLPVNAPKPFYAADSLQ
jgi:hypothetical protein